MKLIAFIILLFSIFSAGCVNTVKLPVDAEQAKLIPKNEALKYIKHVFYTKQKELKNHEERLRSGLPKGTSLVVSKYIYPCGFHDNYVDVGSGLAYPYSDLEFAAKKINGDYLVYLTNSDIRRRWWGSRYGGCHFGGPGAYLTREEAIDLAVQLLAVEVSELK